MVRNALAGQRFGKWLVLKQTGRNKWYEALYHCRCTCGAESKTVLRCALLSGTSTQCRDCGRKAAGKTRTKPYGVAAINAVYSTYYEHAVARNYIWNITKDDFSKLIFQPCYYCGAPPSQIVKGCVHAVLYNGVDRVDNSKGYIAGNLVTACGICNRWKSNMNVESFLKHAQRIVSRVASL